jgi:HAMP domain-containing protein
MKKKTTLRSQFFRQLLVVMIIVAVVTGGLQMWLMYVKMKEDIDNQAETISYSIQQGIKETDMAANALEHQIDLKLESYSKQIADKLRGRSIEQITNEELMRIRDEVGVTGITLFVRTADDIVGSRGTDAHEVGFGMKSVNPYAFEMLDMFMKKEKMPEGLGKIISYLTDDTAILYTSQSGSHEKEPTFFKYGYHMAQGFDFLIDPYIEANEVYKFTQDVGPDSWIKEVLSHNDNAIEIAVLDPRVFADPSLAEKMYPPLQKVVNGSYTLEDEQDKGILANMMKNAGKTSYLDTVDGKRTYKAFLPIREDRVLYIALDYGKMSWPFYRHAIIIVISGFVSLVALFMLTARFFNRIYQHIQQIIIQIRRLEAGDITAKSTVRDKGELGSLSESANKMVDSLNQVLTDAYDRATQAQRLSMLLETEANNSVDKAFTMSMENTSKARESVEEVYYLLDQMAEYLEQHEDPKTQGVLEKLDGLRTIARERSNSTAEITITLSDLFKSLHAQSSELSDISGSLLQKLTKFKL